MKRIRYLSLLWLLLVSTMAWAQFDPQNPAEPGAVSKLTVLANPTDGGTVSESGLFVIGSSVTVSASVKDGFRFVNWTDESGNQKSTNKNYTFAKGSSSETLIANFVYDPSAPAEPDEMPFRLILKAEEGGTVSSKGGLYRHNETVHISASAKTLYEFVGWYYEDGSLLSSTASYNYTMDSRTTTLTAKFKYVPESPAEPDELKQKYKLILIEEEGGEAYATTTRLAKGENTNIWVTTKTGYQFVGWYLGNTLYSIEANTTFTMGEANVELTARFKYTPNSPNEPDPAPERTYAFTLYNVSCKPGVTIDFPVYLTTREAVKDMTFQLTFDERLHPDLDNVVVSDKASSYTSIERTAGVDIDGMNTYIYTFTGGQLEAGNTILLKFSIPIPETMETGAFYPVAINQISMTTTDDATQSGGARNGRVSVYKLGDTNGDNEVNSADVLNIVTVALQKDTEIFIEEVSDINEDGQFTSADVLGIVNIVLEK